jgi:uncharacterized protein
MTAESTNVAILKDAYQRWHESKGATVDHWMSLMIDDVLFRSLAAGAAPMTFTRTASSKDQVRDYFTGLAEEWTMIYYRVDEYIAQNDRVVALGEVSFRHKKSGKVAITPKADIHRFRDGKICEFFEFYDTAGIAAAVA